MWWLIQKALLLGVGFWVLVIFAFVFSLWYRLHYKDSPYSTGKVSWGDLRESWAEATGDEVDFNGVPAAGDMVITKRFDSDANLVRFDGEDDSTYHAYTPDSDSNEKVNSYTALPGSKSKTVVRFKDGHPGDSKEKEPATPAAPSTPKKTPEKEQPKRSLFSLSSFSGKEEKKEVKPKKDPKSDPTNAQAEWKELAQEYLQDILNYDLEADLGTFEGLDVLKNKLRNIKRAQLAHWGNVAQGHPPRKTEPCLHMVFAGNPGTGKTTVAHIVAKILQQLHCIEKNTVFAYDSTHLVAEYAGQTGPRVRKALEAAKRGVCLIDEAYQLMNDKNYGSEAIDTLNNYAELLKGQIVIILMGYTDKMRMFLRANPGLASRFQTVVEFKDYSPPELANISVRILKDMSTVGYDPDIEEQMAQFYKQILTTPEGDIKSLPGNGRGARNVIERAMENLPGRLTYQECADLGFAGMKLDTEAIREALHQLTTEHSFLDGPVPVQPKDECQTAT